MVPIGRRRDNSLELTGRSSRGNVAAGKESFPEDEPYY